MKQTGSREYRVKLADSKEIVATAAGKEPFILKIDDEAAEPPTKK